MCIRDRKKPIAKDLYQSTVGILGLGAIGKAVARRLKGFDCKILAFDSVYDEEFVKEYGIQKAAVDEILRTADFLTLHLPALPEFSPLLDAEAFLKLKKDAVIINTARAKLIDQNALYEMCIRDSHIIRKNLRILQQRNRHLIQIELILILRLHFNELLQLFKTT